MEQLYERVARAELAHANLTRTSMEAIRSRNEAVERATSLEVENAVLVARIEALERSSRFCRLDKSEQIHRAVMAEQRVKELESRPDLTYELAAQVQNLEEKLNRMRLDSAEQIRRALNAERRVQELEGRLAQVGELEAVVEYLEKRARYGLEERAVQIHRAVKAEQKVKALMEDMADLERRVAEAVVCGGFVFEV